MAELDEDTFSLENAFENPDLAAAAAAVAEGNSTAQEPPVLRDPLDGPITLVAGFRRAKAGPDGTEFEEVRKAWVRELNGEDEERIARTKLKDDFNAFLRAVLEAGVEKLGDQKPTNEDFDSLFLGDRDYLLHEIARATYGDTIEFETVSCRSCGEEVGVELSLSEDVPISRLDRFEDSIFKVELRRNRVATVTLPTGEIARDIAKAETDAEANTVLIKHCVMEIEGPKGIVKIQGDEDAARRLGIVDRRTLITEMSAHMPGPRYNEVKFNHEPGCGEEIRLLITLADLFRGL